MVQLEPNSHNQKTVFPTSAFGASQQYFKRYLSARELRRLHQSAGSPVLAAVHDSQESPMGWIPADPGVDEQGFYEFIEQFDHTAFG